MKKSLVMSVLVVAILLLGAVAYASADTVSKPGTGSPLTATDTVTVKANVQAKLVMNVTTPAGTQTVDFGTVFPGVAQAAQNVTLNIWSNKTYQLQKDVQNVPAIGLTTSLPVNSAGGVTAFADNAAGTLWTDVYNLNVPYSVAPGAITQTITYTAVQN
jgi:hypothetical protein